MLLCVGKNILAASGLNATEMTVGRSEAEWNQ